MIEAIISTSPNKANIYDWIHYYLKVPIDCTITQKAYNGIDIKCNTGYCVAPPSEHPAGSFYEWVEGQSLTDLLLADCPYWVLYLAMMGHLPGEIIQSSAHMC